MDRTRSDAETAFPDPDLFLLERFRAGEEAAFDEIVRRYQGMVYRLLRTLVGWHLEADDLTQEVFLRAWRNLRKFEGRSTLKTWLTRIAINAALNHRASGWVRNRVEPIEGAGMFETPAPSSGGGLGALLRREEQSALEAAIEGLPNRQRETLRRVLEGEMKYAEIARAMSCTEGTVKANFFYAVRNLRRALNPE